MSSDRNLKRIEELFDAALDLPADQRAAFLRRAAPGEPELWAAVESLIAGAESGDSFLEGSPLPTGAAFPTALQPGTQLDHFEIVSLAGVASG